MAETEVKTKEKKEPITPKATGPAPYALYFADAAMRLRKDDDTSIEWASEQLDKMEQDGFPVLTSVLSFPDNLKAYLIKEVLSNPATKWFSRTYRLAAVSDKQLPSIEPTGAPLPAEKIGKFVSLKVGLRSSFEKKPVQATSVVEKALETSQAVESLLQAAVDNYQMKNNPYILQEISIYGTNVRYSVAMSLLRNYGKHTRKIVEKSVVNAGLVFEVPIPEAKD